MADPLGRPVPGHVRVYDCRKCGAPHGEGSDLYAPHIYYQTRDGLRYVPTPETPAPADCPLSDAIDRLLGVTL